MKKIVLAVLALSLLISVPAFAKETETKEMPGMSVDKAVGMPMPGMEKMCGPMMNKAQMVATDEGGVIVLAGNKLMKYDAELNLVKEAEVKMSMPPMGGKQCPMMGKMMDKDASADAGSQEKNS